MLIKNSIRIGIGVLLATCFTLYSVNSVAGQVIKVNTRFRSFIGKPSWLIVVRDLDKGENIPYLFDIDRGENFWLIFTMGRDYLIVASEMQISTFRSRYNTYGLHKINDFCHLESHGRIIHGESMEVSITGNLTYDPSTVQCHVTRYPE